jgi:hypothetical protein
MFFFRPQGHDGGGQQPMPPAWTLSHLSGQRAPPVGAERVAGHLARHAAGVCSSLVYQLGTMKHLKSWDHKGILRESCGDYMGFYGIIRDYCIRGDKHE